MSNSEEFNAFVNDLFKECINTLKIKGVDYASDDDRFLTTKRIAEMNGLTVRQVLGVFLTKHIITILRGVSTTEPMRSRIIDAINFLVLIEKWDSNEQP